MLRERTGHSAREIIRQRLLLPFKKAVRSRRSLRKGITRPNNVFQIAPKLKRTQHQRRRTKNSYKPQKDHTTTTRHPKRLKRTQNQRKRIKKTSNSTSNHKKITQPHANTTSSSSNMALEAQKNTTSMKTEKNRLLLQNGPKEKKNSTVLIDIQNAAQCSPLSARTLHLLQECRFS